MAQYRHKFEELFFLQLSILSFAQKRNGKYRGFIFNKVGDLFRRFYAEVLPFQLTDAQKRVMQDIRNDLVSGRQMNRLLQGDVGSGKTVVAIMTMLLAIDNGYQACIMAPTEILAEQHHASISRMLSQLGLRVELLTGVVKGKRREAILEGLNSGEVNIIVGTHALLEDPVQFRNLGCAIIDEQHRFGVRQRQLLREKGENPDVLAMTATPIPRTLAITTYGEMDVSIIDQLPAGRKPIETRWLRENQSGAALSFLKEQLADGAQVYVVSPLIEQSESIDVKNATDLYEKFAEYFAPDYRVGLLHGRMSSDEKAAVMQQFKDNQLQVLVATTVIEVGVDNPNATVMLIYDADRFGLAQLHQLRGRVGRGQRQSYCLLIADPKTEDGQDRMQTMTETTDGFAVAQRDLELRGSGDVLGTNQSGLPQFKVGDPIGDLKMLQTARADAGALLAAPHWDEKDENQPLVLYLKHHQLETHFD